MGQDADLNRRAMRDSRRLFGSVPAWLCHGVKPEDLSVERQGGVPVITAAYEFRTKLVGNAAWWSISAPVQTPRGAR